MKIATLHDLYVEEIKGLYSGEQQLLKALPKMAKAAISPQLAKAFTDHVVETKAQLERLEKIFKKLDVSPTAKTCKVMEALLAEGNAAISDDADPTIKDATLIALAQRIKHLEMAGYGSTRTFARLLGCEESADLLQKTLDEEWAADKKLTKVAEAVINVKAVAAAGRNKAVALST